MESMSLHLLKGNALLDNLIEGLAAVQHLLVEPSPRPLPDALGVYLQGIQHHGYAGQAAICWFILGVELLDQRKEGLCRAISHRFRQVLLACMILVDSEGLNGTGRPLGTISSYIALT